MHTARRGLNRANATAIIISRDVILPIVQYAFIVRVIILSAALALSAAPARAIENGDLWPLAQGNMWKFLDGKAKPVELSVVRTGPKSVQVGGKKHSVTAYIVATSFGGTIMREETFFILNGSVYKMATAQLVNNVRTDFEPPIKIADPSLSVGSSLNYSGKATISGTGIKTKVAFGVKAEYRVVASGSQRIKGEALPTYQVAGELTFYDSDGSAVFGGEESIQFILSVGPGRVSQSGGFEEMALVLQDFSLTNG